MKFRTASVKPLCAFLMFLVMMPSAFGVKAQPKSLKERVKDAELVFVGKVVNRVVKGDWVRAELVVEKPFRGVKKGEKVKVIWRKTLGGREVYDTGEDSRGIALLKGKHEGRYWLRADKFEGGEKLEEVKKLVVKR